MKAREGGQQEDARGGRSEGGAGQRGGRLGRKRGREGSKRMRVAAGVKEARDNAGAGSRGESVLWASARAATERVYVCTC